MFYFFTETLLEIEDVKISILKGNRSAKLRFYILFVGTHVDKAYFRTVIYGRAEKANHFTDYFR